MCPLKRREQIQLCQSVVSFGDTLNLQDYSALLLLRDNRANLRRRWATTSTGAKNVKSTVRVSAVITLVVLGPSASGLLDLV